MNIDFSGLLSSYISLRTNCDKKKNILKSHGAIDYCLGQCGGSWNLKVWELVILHSSQ